MRLSLIAIVRKGETTVCNFRTKIGPISTSVLLALFVTACGPQAQQATGAATPENNLQRDTKTIELAKQRGGKLTAPTGAFGNPNDPHLPATATGRSYSQPITNGILKRDVYDKNYGIIPDLAKSWEVSTDGKTYTFKFNQGVKFHNLPPVSGREFTSEDAKYSIMRVTADPSVIVAKWKPRFQRAIDFGEVASIDTPDKYTLIVNLKNAYAPFLDAIAHPGTQVLPREFVEQFPEKIITEGAIGTGPFMAGEFKHNVIATYKRNPDYWKKDASGGQLPYLDEVASPHFADTQTQMASFRARQLDFTGSFTGADLNEATLNSIVKDNPGVQVLRTPGANIATLRFNTKVKAFQDPRVRRAFHLAIDRHQLLELVTEGVGVLSGPVTNPIFPELANTTDWLLQQPGYRKDKTQDLTEAKRLMKEAGYENGLELGLLNWANSSSDTWASLLADQLKAINVMLKNETVDYAGVWVPRATNGEFDFTVMTHTVGTDVDSVISAHLLSGAPRNYGKFSSERLDGLLVKERLATTTEERRKWAQEAENVILEEAPMLFIYTNVYRMMAQPWVHNIANGWIIGTNTYQLEHAWLDNH